MTHCQRGPYKNAAPESRRTSITTETESAIKVSDSTATPENLASCHISSIVTAVVSVPGTNRKIDDDNSRIMEINISIEPASPADRRCALEIRADLAERARDGAHAVGQIVRDIGHEQDPQRAVQDE